MAALGGGAEGGGADGGDEGWIARWLEGNPNGDDKPVIKDGKSVVEVIARLPRKPLPPGVDPLEERNYHYPKATTGDEKVDEKMRSLIMKFKAISVVRASLLDRLVANGNKKLSKAIADDIRWALELGVDAHNDWIALEKENASPREFNPIYLKPPKRPEKIPAWKRPLKKRK